MNTLLNKVAAFAAFTISAGLLPNSAFASDMTGNTLLEYCGTSATTRDSPATWQQGVCDGYITGAEGVLVSAGVVCPPDGVTNAQVIDIASKYLIEHPEIRERPAHLLVGLALKATFQCPH